MEKLIVKAHLDGCCADWEAAAEPRVEFQGFSLHHVVQCKGKPATVLVLGTWKVSDKSPRRIQILSLHSCFVFPSTLKRNQWTYKCAALTSYIVPLGSDTSAAMKQLQAGMALWHWHANEQSQWTIFQSLWMLDFDFFIYFFCGLDFLKVLFTFLCFHTLPE